MIDIHTHIIPFVDDGAKSLESSLKMIEKEISIGVTDIILTPHYRKNMFETSLDDIKDSFNQLKEEVEKRKLNVKLFLGQEIYCNDSKELIENLEENKVITINNKKYILLEFHYIKKIDVSEIVYLIRLKGYIPIIAHIERYEYLNDIDKIYDLVESGALIQVNASSIIGKHGGKIKKFCMKLIKNNLIDFISSDIHENRENYLDKAYKFISKKLTQEIANKLFIENAKKLID